MARRWRRVSGPSTKRTKSHAPTRLIYALTAMISENRIVFVVVVTIIAVHFVLREATFEKAAIRKGGVRFPAGRGMRAIFWVGAPLELFGAYELLRQIHSSTDWFFPIILIALALGTVYFDPGTLVTDESGVSLHKYFGLHTEKLEWDNVESVVVAKALKTISVFGRDGRSIIHTQFHVDPLRFQAEVKKHLRSPIIEQ